MLKMATSFVLGCLSPCDVRNAVRLGRQAPCGLAGYPFWASC